MKKIIVIGATDLEDQITLFKIGEFLRDVRNQPEFFEQFMKDKYLAFDMGRFPERGDAYDAVDSDTDLVVALHLYGIGDMPGYETPSSNPYLFRGKNPELTARCMELNVPLIASGDQPWYGVEQKTAIYQDLFGIYLYEPSNFQWPSPISESSLKTKLFTNVDKLGMMPSEVN